MKIKVYCTKHCPYCVQLKDWLSKDIGAEYEEIRVDDDRTAAEYMIVKSGQMVVPQTEINGKIIVGFNKDELIKEMGL